MLKIKKSHSLIAFLLCTITFNSAYTMQASPNFPAEYIGKRLLGQRQPEQPFNFSALPKDIRDQIIELLSINTTAESLKIAAYTINALAQVNKELNQMINNSGFCLNLIKHLSKKFNCSNEEAAKSLRIKAAKDRLILQEELKNACLIIIDIESLKIAYKNGADLEFTYYFPLFCMTPLMLSIYHSIPSPTEQLLTQQTNLSFFLTLPINVNQAEPTQGKTALMLACQAPYRSWAIKILINTPNININQQDNNGDTALMLCIKKNCTEQTIRDLLEAGADLNIKNIEGETPLQILQLEHPQFQEALNNYLQNTQQK